MITFGEMTWTEHVAPEVQDRIASKRMLKKQREDADWVQLAQDRVQWPALVDTVTNPRVPQKAGNFLSSRISIQLLTNDVTLLHAVRYSGRRASASCSVRRRLTEKRKLTGTAACCNVLTVQTCLLMLKPLNKATQ
jgi:hypothetical protein